MFEPAESAACSPSTSPGGATTESRSGRSSCFQLWHRRLVERRTSATLSRARVDDREVETRVRVAEVLAFVGLVAALVGALGPADRVRTTYSWPPETLPEGTPKKLWYTPLLLVEAPTGDPSTATLPCASTPPLTGAGEKDGACYGAIPRAAREGSRMLRAKRVAPSARGRGRGGSLAGSRGGLPPHASTLAGGRWSPRAKPGETAPGALGRCRSSRASSRRSTSAPAPPVGRGRHRNPCEPHDHAQTVAWIVAALALAVRSSWLASMAGRGGRPVLAVARRGSAHPVDAVVGRRTRRLVGALPRVLGRRLDRGAGADVQSTASVSSYSARSPATSRSPTGSSGRSIG